MTKNMVAYKDIDEYIANYPTDVQKKLKNIRKTIAEVNRDATETISYGIPTFKLNGKNLVHFAAYESHIGFYPGSHAIKEFSKDLKSFNTSKGTIQFTLVRSIPYNLIAKITKFCVEQRLK